MTLNDLGKAAAKLLLVALIGFGGTGCATLESASNAEKSRSLARFAVFAIVTQKKKPEAAADRLISIATEVLIRVESGQIVTAQELSETLRLYIPYDQLSQNDRILAHELVRILMNTFTQMDLGIVDEDDRLSPSDFLRHVIDSAKFAGIVYQNR